MTDDIKPFVKPPLKRGLKKPPGAENKDDEASSSGSSGSSTNFLPADAKQAFNSPPSLILPFLYLGSQYNAASKKQITQLQIKRILDLKERQTGTDIPEVVTLTVPMSDHGDTAITEVLPECFRFIEDSKSQNDILLVHWYVGPPPARFPPALAPFFPHLPPFLSPHLTNTHLLLCYHSVVVASIDQRRS